MSWKETSVMEERMKFIADYGSREYTKSELQRRYGISRPTVYKWIQRYEEEGCNGLQDRSRAPIHHPNAVSAEIESYLLEARKRHPTWGAKKLLPWLKKIYPKQTSWPVESTVGEILKRHGLVHACKRKRRVSTSQAPLSVGVEPNAVWCADFKGWVRTGDRKKCFPLTITDAYSRYLLCCQGMRKIALKRVKATFEIMFHDYGLPDVIRTDNGVPFASTGLLGLSPLSIWWIKLGIVPERIQPGKPQQNGSHERMHRTLKAEALSPPAATLRSQQRKFDRLQEEYNWERPHEALRQIPPASVYTASSRPYPAKVETTDYPVQMEVRKVRKSGQFCLWGCDWFLSEALAGESIGIEEIEDGIWDVYLLDIKVAWINQKTMTLNLEGTKQKRKAGNIQ